MKIYKKLYLNINKKNKVIYFGVPDSQEELVEMYQMRMSIYAKKDYFHEKVYENNPKNMDVDDYDKQDKCHYFIAKIDNKIIGSVRTIYDEYLPAEKYFKFEEPDAIKKIPRKRRVEISRLVIDRYSEVEHPPRNLVMLFLLGIAMDYLILERIPGGYSFIKEKLKGKLLKLKGPVHVLNKYIQQYPDDGVLYNYFNQKKDLVTPAYFLTKEVHMYVSNILENKKMFEKKDKDTYSLKDTFYNAFLRKLKII